MRLRVLILVVAMACSTSAPLREPPAAPPPTPPSACPGADRYVPIVWSNALERRNKPPTVAGWRAVLLQHPDEAETARGYEELDAARASAAGLTTLPKAVWVMVDGKPPCRASVTRPFRSEYQYGVELAGCEQLSTGKPMVSAGLAGEDDFSGCNWAVARFKDVPDVPAELEGHVAKRGCGAGACKHVVLLGRAGAVATAYAYDVAQAWLDADPAKRCSHRDGDTVEIAARGPRGWVTLTLPDSPGRPALAGAFFDREGTRMVVLEAYGATDIYAVDATRPVMTLAERREYAHAATPKSFRDPIVEGCPR